MDNPHHAKMAAFANRAARARQRQNKQMSRTDPRRPSWNAFVFLLNCLAATLFGGAARCDTAWEHEPYRVRIVVAVDTTPRLTGPVVKLLVEDLKAQSEAFRAAVWQVDVTVADTARSRDLVRRTTQLTSDDVREWQKARDKVLLLAISSTSDELRLAARDFDCQTQRWGSAVTRRIRQPLLLRSLAFRILAEAFAPLAQVEVQERSRVRLRLRASALARATDAPTNVSEGTFFVPVLRINDREGNPVPGGIRTVPWTFLRVAEADEQQIICEIFSGLNQPIRKRSRGRIEQLAVKVTPHAAPTRLMLRSRSSNDTPLIGYELFCRKAVDEPLQRIGQTDAAGDILVSPGMPPLRTLFVKHGNQMLARLPVLDGYASEMVAYLPDNTPLLEAEGFVSRLQDALTDVVARRGILMVRARRQMETKDFEAAQRTLDALQTLATQSEFLQQIAQHQQQTVSDDRSIQARIDQLYARTEKIVTSYLDARSINMLQSEFDKR